MASIVIFCRTATAIKASAGFVASGRSFLEQTFEALANVIARLAGSHGGGLIWKEEVAKVSLFAVRNPLGLRFAAPIVR